MLRAGLAESLLRLTRRPRQPHFDTTNAQLSFHAPPSRDAALRPRDFSHWRTNEKSLVCFWSSEQTLETAEFDKIDAFLDDGSAETGSLRLFGSDRYYWVLEE